MLSVSKSPINESWSGFSFCISIDREAQCFARLPPKQVGCAYHHICTVIGTSSQGFLTSKVAQLCQLIAGLFAVKTLADFGGNVIKIEPSSDGDSLRQWCCFHSGTWVWWQMRNKNCDA